MAGANGSETVFFTVSSELQLVDRILNESIHVSGVPLIKEVASHVIASGGKRIRPALAILSAKICGYQGGSVPYLASAVELIHTASLIHDDVLDSADLRRGAPTANARWGNHVSVLVGDYCLSLASQLLAKHTNQKIISVLTDAARETTEGEVLEVVYSNDLNMNEETYMNIIKHKTSYLIAASCEAGSILAEAPERLSTSLRDYGMNLGVAFQMVDDVLDLTIDSSALGKRRGTDLREGKLTLPIIYALKLCRPQERVVIKESLLAPACSDDQFRSVIDILDRYGCISKAIRGAENYLNMAIEALKPFKPSLEKDALIKFATFVVSRKS